MQKIELTQKWIPLQSKEKKKSMKINLKSGIDKLIFGMKQNDVIAIYGKPNKNYNDEDDNVIFVYNNLKIRMTFYKDEELKLGYLVASSPNLELFGNKIIAKKISDVKKIWHKKELPNLLKKSLILSKIILMRRIGLFFKPNLMRLSNLK
ncbi:hypothetical protein CLU83_2280 [Flavobacterium sp. 1]|nr:hypothetical protein CLU83_2280 [Flavobacterium sp. 1]